MIITMDSIRADTLFAMFTILKETDFLKLFLKV